jgi:hypothetical protein
MLAAVQFDDESRFPATEVHHESADRKLPDEFVSVDLAGSDPAPQGSFGIGLRAPQATLLFRARRVHVFDLQPSP